MPRTVQPIAVSEKNGAAILDMAPQNFRELVACGALPPPTKLGGLERWLVSDLEAIFTGAVRRPTDDEDFK